MSLAWRIARRERWPAFLIRRDPRDISRIWVLEPEGQHYLEIPYRTLSHPAVTLWEQRQALAKLRQQGREQVDESALFRMIGQMREIVTTAQKATRKARRDADRVPLAFLVVENDADAIVLGYLAGSIG